VLGNTLDLGAVGVIVPMVDDAAAAARAVSACRHAPEGERSFGTLRGGPAAGGRPLCLVMVETRTGLENVDEIAATPGLDGIYIGPADLALSLGVQPALRVEDEALLEAIERVRAACERHGLIAGMHCLVGDDVPRYAAQGFALITAAVDVLLLGAAIARTLAAARGDG
jgi:4-hydroxy-2-oxoheptanedioate aldolase